MHFLHYSIDLGYFRYFLCYLFPCYSYFLKSIFVSYFSIFVSCSSILSFLTVKYQGSIQSISILFLLIKSILNFHRRHNSIRLLYLFTISKIHTHCPLTQIRMEDRYTKILILLREVSLENIFITAL